MSLLDFLFPKYCVACRRGGAYVCSDCFSFITFTEHSVCAQCHRPALAGLTHPTCQTRYSIDGIFASVAYQGTVKKLVHNFKYQPFLKDISPFLVELLAEGMIQKEFVARLLSESVVITSVPLHKKRLRWRGYNQSSILARGLADKLSLPLWEGLIRVKETKRQVGLPQIKRAENMKGAFSVAEKGNLLEYTHIFLVDDVVTSGATLQEAANVLKRAGAEKVWGIALAHG